jgi:RNA polymerase sigma factor (sigma-70 family)
MNGSPWGQMSQNQDELIEWVGRCVLPCEGSARAWLRRASVKPSEIDDIIQEGYSRIASIESFRHITNPRAYFVGIVRNILFEQLRRSRIVRIDTVAELDALNISDNSPDPERAMSAKDELVRLRRLIDALPARCRRVFVLRKIDGLSQKQIAERLGITVNTVETQVGRGLRLILKAWVEDTRAVRGRQGVDYRQNAVKKRD